MASTAQAGPPLVLLREDSREAPLWPPQPRNTGKEAIWPGQGVARNSTSGYYVVGKPCFGDQGPGVCAYSCRQGMERCLSPLLGVELSELLSGTGTLCFLRTSFFSEHTGPTNP